MTVEHQPRPEPVLFPNGGWDVHHHIFERMILDFPHKVNTILCNIILMRFYIQRRNSPMLLIDTSLRHPRPSSNSSPLRRKLVLPTRFSRTVYRMDRTAHLSKRLSKNWGSQERGALGSLTPIRRHQRSSRRCTNRASEVSESTCTSIRRCTMWNDRNKLYVTTSEL